MATCINIYIDPDEIDPDDDPRWIELARDIPVVFRRYNAAQWALAETMPTTAAGLKALLSHLNKHQARECVRHKRPAQYMAWPAQRCHVGRGF